MTPQADSKVKPQYDAARRLLRDLDEESALRSNPLLIARALRQMRGHPREVEVWTFAAEAARFFGNVRESAEALVQIAAVFA
jgi:hypothetical protein